MTISFEFSGVAGDDLLWENLSERSIPVVFGSFDG